MIHHKNHHLKNRFPHHLPLFVMLFIYFLFLVFIFIKFLNFFNYFQINNLFDFDPLIIVFLSILLLNHF